MPDNPDAAGSDATPALPGGMTAPEHCDRLLTVPRGQWEAEIARLATINQAFAAEVADLLPIRAAGAKHTGALPGRKQPPAD